MRVYLGHHVLYVQCGCVVATRTLDGRREREGEMLRVSPLEIATHPYSILAQHRATRAKSLVSNNLMACRCGRLGSGIQRNVLIPDEYLLLAFCLVPTLH